MAASPATIRATGRYTAYSRGGKYDCNGFEAGRNGYKQAADRPRATVHREVRRLTAYEVSVGRGAVRQWCGRVRVSMRCNRRTR